MDTRTASTLDAAHLETLTGERLVQEYVTWRRVCIELGFIQAGHCDVDPNCGASHANGWFRFTWYGREVCERRDRFRKRVLRMMELGQRGLAKRQAIEREADEVAHWAARDVETGTGMVPSTYW